MSILQFIKLFLLTTVVFFVIDLVWLGVVAVRFYDKQLGHLLSPEVRWAAAILFYLIFIAGMLVFAAIPAIKEGSLGKAVLLGAFFGFVTYATFDLTCLALFKDFPVKVVVVDMIWGTCLAATVTSAAYGIGRWLGIG